VPDLSNRARGAWGERRAAAALRHAGFAIVDRNWRAPERSASGELDLVARRDRLLVFCEVKARRRADLGGAVAAVGPAKQERIRVLAESWLHHHPTIADAVDEIRFDVIAIDGVDLRHWVAAF
jgi:putative endonuclease